MIIIDKYNIIFGEQQMAIQLSGVSLGIISGGPSSLTLEDLADVSIITPLNGQFLTYNSSLSEWVNTTGTATNATNVQTTIASVNQTYPIMLSSSVSAGFQTPTFDSDLQYNPVTDVLTVPGSISSPSFTSTVTTGTSPFSVSSTTQVNNLTAQYATNAVNVEIAATTSNAPFYITLSDASSGYQALDVDVGFNLNPSTGVLTVPGTITITSGTVTNLTTPIGSTDAANKAYVDAAVSSLVVHEACEVLANATSTVVMASSYANGSADLNGGTGIGATLTDSTSGTVLVIDGHTVLSTDRILVTGFTSGSAIYNGIYSVQTLGILGTVKWVLVRASDFNDSSINEVVPGVFVFVSEGTTYAGTGWVETAVGTSSSGGAAPGAIKIGTDAIIFTQFSGAGTYSAGTGLSLTGTTFANTGVLSLTSNTGLSTNTSSTGNVTITNTGVTSIVAGTNISVSGATGAVTVNVTGTVPTATAATNLSGTIQYSIPYQSSSANTSYVSPGTIGSVFITDSTSGAPSWSTTPTILGTNISGTAASLTAGLATAANGLKSATTTVSVSSATAPTTGQVLTATSTTAATWQTPVAGSVTSVSVSSANGFAGTVATSTTTPAITLTTSISGVLKGSSSALVAATAGTDFVAPATATNFTATQTFTGSTSVTAMKIMNVTELVDVVGTAAASTYNFYIASGSIQLITANAANNWITNIAFSSGTSMNTEMATGDSITLCMLVTQGSTPYYCTAVNVDGTVQTVHWQGGTAPSAGNASGIDAYNFTVIKTASATYTILGTLTQF